MPAQPMPNLFQRFGSRLADILDPTRTAKLDAATHAMEVAIRNYNEGPLILTRDNLISTLKEAGHNQDLLLDLVDSLQWEAYGMSPAMSDTQRQRAVRTSRRLWVANPLYQWGVWLWTNYGFGEEVAVEPNNVLAARVWEEFWIRSNMLAADRIQNLSHETLVDGESFFAYHADDSTGIVITTSIDPSEIVEIITHPMDKNKPIFYKREHNTVKDGLETIYYPDWEAFFDGIIDRQVNQNSPKTLAQVLNIKDDVRADRKWTQTQIDPSIAQFTTEKDKMPPRLKNFIEDGVLKIRAQKLAGSPGTITVLQHIAHNRKSRKSLRGWPLSTVANPWLYSHRQFVSDRLAVSAGKASIIRRYQTKGGSQAVQSIRGAIASGLNRYNLTDSNPPGTAGGSLVHNEAISDFQDMSMVTGASDAKNDNETFSWMAILGLGSFPHYFGLGDAYRLATACYSEDTQVLTENGWKYWDEWRKGEKIATYDHAHYRILYAIPTRLHVYEYDGKMIHIVGRNVDLCVTPNHRMLALNENNIGKGGAKKEFEVIEADSLPSRFALPSCAHTENQQRWSHFTIPVVKDSRLSRCSVEMDDFLQFIGWFVTEGWLNHSGANYTIGLCQHRDSPDVSEITSLVARLPFKFSCTTNETTGLLRWRTNDKALYEWLEGNCGKGAHNKHLPNFVFNLNLEQAELLVDTLWDGDGHWERKESYEGCITSTSKVLIDQIQRLLLHIGRWGHIAINRYEDEKVGVKHSHTCYILHRNQSLKIGLSRKRNVQQIDYDGVVWCFEAPPHGMFITRRNGRPLIAGNTAMEKPLELTYSAYRRFWSAQFTRMARIVFMFNNLFGTVKITDPTVIVTTDRATTIDLINAAPSIKALFSDTILPAVDKGILPGDAATTIGKEVIMLILDSLGASGDRGEIADMLAKWLEQKKKDEEEAAARAPQVPPQDEDGDDEDEEDEDDTTPTEQLVLPPDLEFLRENIASGTVDVADVAAHLIELLEESNGHG